MRETSARRGHHIDHQARARFNGPDHLDVGRVVHRHCHGMAERRDGHHPVALSVRPLDESR